MVVSPKKDIDRILASETKKEETPIPAVEKSEPNT
jgi:hypothetical protein